MGSIAAPIDAGVSTGGDVYSEIGEAIQSAIPDSGSEDSPGGEGGSEPSEFAPATEDTPIGEAPTGETEVAPTNEPYPLTEDGNSYLVPKAELAELAQLREFNQAVQTHFPTVQDAQNAHAMSHDFLGMRYDFASGDPAKIDQVLNFWAGANAQNPRERARFQEAFSVMTQRAPKLLQQLNPQAYEGMSKEMALPHVEALYRDAAATADPKQKQEIFKAAQWMDYKLRGEYKTELPVHNPDAEAATAAQNAEKQRLQGIEQREAKLLERDFNYFNQQFVDGPKLAAVDAEISKVLAPIKDKYDANDFGEIQKGILGDLTKAMRADADWWSSHMQEWADIKSEFQHCWKTGQDPNAALKQRAEYYKNDLLVRARRVLPSLAKPRLDKAANLKVAATQPRKPQARQATPVKPQTAAPTTNGNGHYDVREDPDFLNIFRLPAR